MCYRNIASLLATAVPAGTKTTPPADLPQVARSPQVEFLTNLRFGGKKSLPTEAAGV